LRYFWWSLSLSSLAGLRQRARFAPIRCAPYAKN